MYSVHAGVSPNEHYTGFLVVTRELTVPHSGRYNLNVEARLPDHRFPVPQHEMIFFRAQSFALNVVPPDSAKLQEIAEAFRQAAVMESDFNQRITAVRALLSMPEQYALASWQALAEDARFRHGEVLMNELARAMTPSAADVLAFLWVAGPGSLVLGNLSTVLLDNMYRAGDDALKQHIKEIFSQRGKAISNHPLMFVGA